MKSRHLKTILFGVWMLGVLLSCNLGETNEQPILEARSSPTPAPTMGYAPLDPI